MTSLETRVGDGSIDERVDRAIALLSDALDNVEPWLDPTLLAQEMDQQECERSLGRLVIRASTSISPRSHRSTPPDATQSASPRQLGSPPVALNLIPFTGRVAPTAPAPVPANDRSALKAHPIREVAAAPAPVAPHRSSARPEVAAPALAVVGEPAAVKPVTDPAWVSVGRQRRARQALWMESVGAIVLLFLMYQWWGTSFEQQRAQLRLRAGYQKLAANQTSANPTPDNPTVGGGPSAKPGSTPASLAVTLLPGGAVARLEIPAIHLDQFVVEGTGEGDLRKGPGHYVGSSMPGQPGNAAIAGHRTTYGAPFSALDQVTAGDTIITTTAAGRFLYVVSGQETVSPAQLSVVSDYGDDRLTLTTCTPRFSASHRLVIIAKLQGRAPATPTPARVTPPPPAATTPLAVQTRVVANLRNHSQDGFKLKAVPAAAVVAAALVGLGLAYRPVRRRLPPVAAVAVLAPLWLSGLLLLFEQLNRFLPANW